MEVGGMDSEGEEPLVQRGSDAEADDPYEELIAPDSPPSPSHASRSWAPGLAASSLFGPRVLRHNAQAPSASGHALLRDLVAAGDTSGAARTRWQVCGRTLSVSSGSASLLALGFLVLLLRWPSEGPSRTGVVPKHTTELAMECTKVACVGASITRGNVVVLGGELASDAPYPMQLQSMLGPGYCVENFGVPGSTALKKSRRPFWDQPELKRVRDFLPDIVVIQFGANDSREKNFDQDFRKDYGSIIELFKGLASRPQVYILAMPPIYPGTASKDGIPGKKYGMNAEALEVLSVPLNLIAKENGLSPPITVLDAFKKHCRKMDAECDWMSGDGVHPNHKGDHAMARLVHLTVAGDNRCTARGSEKEPCGDEFNVTEASCKERGCCYTPDSTGPLWCFRQQKAQPARPEECLAKHDEKTECGFEGDTMEQCRDRGCCYKPSLDGTPWCFHRLQPLHPEIRSEDKYMSLITSTRWSTTLTTTAATTTSRTTSATSTSTTTGTTTTYTGTTFAASLQASGWPLWTAVGGGVALLGLGLLLLLRGLRTPKEEKQQESLDSQEVRTRQEEERRQLRRLQADRAAQSAEKKRQDLERRKGTREVLNMLSDAGFTGINQPKTKRGVFRTSFSYPLHQAVEANNPEAIRLLLSARADASLEDSRRRTPLALAESLNKRDSHSECISALSVGLL